MDQIKIGAFISACRREMGLTQEQLGESLGVSQRSVSRWETGRNLPDLSLLSPLADALGVGVEELLAGEKGEKEVLTRQDMSSLTEKLSGIVVRRRKQVLKAAVILLLTVICMVCLYRGYYSVDISSSKSLEAAIEEYRSPVDSSEVRILRREAVGNRLFVLYRKKGVPGDQGLAELRRGPFGGFQFLGTDDYEYPLLIANSYQIGGRSYSLVFCANDLPEIAAVDFGGWNGTENVTTFTYSVTEYPVLELAEAETQDSFFPFGMRYYDAKGEELPERELLSKFYKEDGTYGGSATGSFELELLWYQEGFILLLGIVFIRYFLSKQS